MTALAVTAVVLAGCNDFKVTTSGTTDPARLDYVESGVNFGKGVRIGDVVWAPVNVGSTKDDRKGAYYSFEDAMSCCPDGWRLPTRYEIEVLNLNHSYLETGYDGLKGQRFSGFEPLRSLVDDEYVDSPAIFLPASGYVAEDGLQYYDVGCYWSSDVVVSNEYGKYVVALQFSESGWSLRDFSAALKHSVRCVNSSTQLAVPSLSFDGYDYRVSSGGGMTGVKLNVKYSDGRDIPESEWALVRLDSEADWVTWLELSADASGEHIVRVTCTANTTGSERSTLVEARLFDEKASFSVTQSPQ